MQNIYPYIFGFLFIIMMFFFYFAMMDPKITFRGIKKFLIFWFFIAISSGIRSILNLDIMGLLFILLVYIIFSAVFVSILLIIKYRKIILNYILKLLKK